MAKVTSLLIPNPDGSQSQTGYILALLFGELSGGETAAITFADEAVCGTPGGEYIVMFSHPLTLPDDETLLAGIRVSREGERQ